MAECLYHDSPSGVPFRFDVALSTVYQSQIVRVIFSSTVVFPSLLGHGGCSLG